MPLLASRDEMGRMLLEWLQSSDDRRPRRMSRAPPVPLCVVTSALCCDFGHPSNHCICSLIIIISLGHISLGCLDDSRISPCKIGTLLYIKYRLRISDGPLTHRYSLSNQSCNFIPNKSILDGFGIPKHWQKFNWQIEPASDEINAVLYKNV